MKRITSVFSSGLVTESRSVLRGLAHKPGYAVAAWVMLGLAIAANASVFAIVWGFMLKPLPYAQPDRLSVVRERIPKIGLDTPLVSVKTYLALKQGLDGIEDAGLSGNANGDVVTIARQPHLLRFEQVTPSLFITLGVNPILGRLPATSAGKPDGPPEAVISERLWQSIYGGRRGVLGQSLKVNDKTYRIVGVMPNDFFVQGGDSDIWMPLVITPELARDDNINFLMEVRRKPDVSLHRLNLELGNYVQRILAKETPDERARDIRVGYTIDARPVRAIALDYFGIGQLPWLLQAAAGLLLLLALANTINLGLVRQRARQHEFALRRVLGASRGGLARLILVEHMPIALAVGGLATLLAWAAVGALHAFGLPPVFSPFKVTLAPAVIAFTWITTLVAILIVAFGPALLASGRKLLATLGHGPTATGGKAPRRLQRTLGVIQISLACALIIAGSLLGVSLWRVLTQATGFAPNNRIVTSVVLPGHAKYSEAWANLKPQLLKLPGVDAVAVTGMLPFSSGHTQGGISKIGAKSNLIVNMPLVGADYFRTMDIRFVAGRAFTADEIANQAPVVIINAALAKRFFGSAQDAIGKHLEFTASSIYKNPRIVGVAQGVRWAPTPDQYRSGTAYLPFGIFAEGFRVIVKSNRPLGRMRDTLKQAIKQALPGSVVYGMSALSSQVQAASTFRAAGAGMVGTFAALALLLAALGVFAITAFIARARLGEYGIRAALGAGPSVLLRLGFREAAWLLAIGLPIGLAGAYLLGRVIASALYQTPVFDVWLYAIGIVLIAAVVFAAAWGPARRAARAPIRDVIGGGGSQ